MDQRTDRCAEPGQSIRKKHLEAAAVYGLDRRGGREPHRESVKGEELGPAAAMRLETEVFKKDLKQKIPAELLAYQVLLEISGTES